MRCECDGVEPTHSVNVAFKAGVDRADRIGTEVRVRVYGHYGQPVLVFPTSGGDEREYEGQGMIDALGHHIQAGRVKLFCINSVNNDSWYNKGIHPADRVRFQVGYDATVSNEILPFIEDHCKTRGIAITTTGASFGAYHAANTLFKPRESFCTATTEGSLAMIPRPLTYTRVFAVPRSMAKSFEKSPKTESKIIFSSLSGA